MGWIISVILLFVVLKEQTNSLEVLWICRSKSKFVFATPFIILSKNFVSAGFWQPHLPCDSVPLARNRRGSIWYTAYSLLPRMSIQWGHASCFIKGRPTSGNGNFQSMSMYRRFSAIFPFKTEGFALSASNYWRLIGVNQKQRQLLRIINSKMVKWHGNMRYGFTHHLSHPLLWLKRIYSKPANALIF